MIKNYRNIVDDTEELNKESSGKKGKINARVCMSLRVIPKQRERER